MALSGTDAAHDEPITEQSPLDGEMTTMGSVGVTQLHHLRALTAALEPARAQYTATAIEQLRSLPAPMRRPLFAQVLAEHPMLAHEPAIQQLATELGVAPTAVAGTATSAAYQRMEAILPVVADGLAALENGRRELAAELGAAPPRQEPLPRNGGDLLAWLLDERVACADRAVQLGRHLGALVVHPMALREAARLASRAVSEQVDPSAAAARAPTPKWWPKPFRDAAVLASLRALHASEVEGRTYLDDVHHARFASAYVARTHERR